MVGRSTHRCIRRGTECRHDSGGGKQFSSHRRQHHGPAPLPCCFCFGPSVCELGLFGLFRDGIGGEPIWSVQPITTVVAAALCDHFSHHRWLPRRVCAPSHTGRRHERHQEVLQERCRDSAPDSSVFARPRVTGPRQTTNSTHICDWWYRDPSTCATGQSHFVWSSGR